MRGLASLLLLLLPLTASAGSVYLNGVNIDGVINQKMEGASVRIDDRGNVLIDAPGYSAKVIQAGPTAAVAPPQVQPVGGSGPPSPVRPGVPPAGNPALAPTPAAGPTATSGAPGMLTQRYFLVTEQTVRGMTDFDIDVYVNARWIRKLYSNEEQIVTDITKFLVPGKNTVTLAARKLHTAARKSFSPEHEFKVIIGTGNVGGDNVMIDVPTVKFVRTAAEDRDITQEFTVVTR